MFRHDRQNTGSTDVRLCPPAAPSAAWVFVRPSPTPGPGAFQASPVLTTDDKWIYIGSTDGTLYVLNAATGQEPVPADNRQPEFVLTAEFGITSTALAARRDAADAIFVGGGDGLLYALTQSGAAQSGSWPFPGGSFISASPNLSVTDGIVYITGLQADFSGVCPNGIGGFIRTIAGSASSPAVGPDNTVYVGADDAQLRAYDRDGVIKWQFSAAAQIFGAPVVEVDATGATAAVYVADLGGHVFKVDPNGRQLFAGPTGAPVGPIRSSPALAPAVKRLYFGSQDGNVYAVNTDSGTIDWAVPTGGAVESSPAVATGGAQPTVVVGSDDGKVYFITDDGSAHPPSEAFPIPTGAAVRSSPAIDGQGTVYVGADDGHVYAIGAACTAGAAG